MTSTFTGIPVAALDFYDDLETDNTKSFWAAHKEIYESSVRAPVTALAKELEPEFGPAKIFRPYRDVRFAKDKTPYKSHQGAFVPRGPATGWYLEVAASGVRVGVGFYEASSPRLARIRDAIVEDRRGKELETIIAELQHEGWTLGGEKLKTTPPRVRPRPSPHRAAPPQVDDAREVLRVRTRDPHSRAAHDGARRLADGVALRGMGVRQLRRRLRPVRRDRVQCGFHASSPLVSAVTSRGSLRSARARRVTLSNTSRRLLLAAIHTSWSTSAASL